MKAKVTRANTVLLFLNVNLISRCNNIWIQKLTLYTSVSWKILQFNTPGSNRM